MMKLYIKSSYRVYHMIITTWWRQEIEALFALPAQKASNAELWCSFEASLNNLLNEQSICRYIWDNKTIIWRRCNKSILDAYIPEKADWIGLHLFNDDIENTLTWNITKNINILITKKTVDLKMLSATFPLKQLYVTWYSKCLRV